MHTEPALAAHLAKYPKLIPALALICHLASGGDGPVSETALLQALAWGDYLASHAKRAYTAGNLAHVSAAKEILKRIRKGDLPNPFTAHTVKRKNWGGLDGQTVDYALDELEECGYLQRSVERGQGRPKEWFFINPHCLGEV